MDQVKLLERWHMRLRITRKAHQQVAVEFEHKARGMGVAALMTSTIVSTSLFADAGTNLSADWKIAS